MLQEVEPGIQSIYLEEGNLASANISDPCPGRGWQRHCWTSERVLKRIEYARGGAEMERQGLTQSDVQLAARKVSAWLPSLAAGCMM